MYFVVLKTRSRFKFFWKQIEKARDETEVCTIVVNAIKEQYVDFGRQSIQVWFGDDVAEEIWKCRFTYGPMTNMDRGWQNPRQM